ncbi:carbon-nitrogen hydrolase family protein [Natrialbaceae archaeon AArc-T1-2]|uniref:carbon-nitrogen hydrolase family protein n=1 Tax=Natrialbaceae archaeon AArc-T1-2 TaxID=3053904 RepID=UPI00255ABD44|nr:carbon-nitrogen hydrolase family protein [Natrialbaceae archaeon AArc-T1-2]WIV66394.1 carbon-nitrogen hydrolase family protein [Natrialbaceae archaeon AArc-T1-2]
MTDDSGTETRTAHVAACQFEPTIGDVDANLAAVRDLAGDLEAGVALAVFPELSLTGYDLEVVADLAEPIPGPLTDRAVSLAREVDTTLVLGLPERVGDAVYNATAVVSPDGLEGVYRKQYAWGDERDVFDAGEGPVTVETSAGTIGLLCCYDLNFPEAALEYARRGCDVLAVTAAWRTSFLADWRLFSRTRARDGPCYVVASNHTGDQQGRDHAGHSLVAGPDGTVRAEADERQGVVTAAVPADDLECERERNPVRETRRARGDW